MKRAVSVALLVVLVIACFFAWARVLAPPWPDRLPNVRLEPTRPILRPDQVTPDNAFYYIRQLTNFAGRPKLSAVTNEYEQFKAMGWSKGSYTQMESIAEGNAEAFALYRKAADVPQCQLVTMSSFTCLVPYVSVVLEKGRALCFDAEWAAGRGDWRTARSDFRAVLRIGDHLTRGGALIDCLVGYAGTATACQGLRRVAVQRSPPKRFLRDMSAALVDIDLHMESIADAMRYERMAGQDVIRMVAEGNVWEFLSLSGSMHQKAKIVRRLARAGLLKNTPAHFDAVYSHIIAESSRPYVAGRSFMNVVPPFRVRNPVRQVGILMDDPIGRLLISLLVPALDQIKERYVGTRAIVRGTALFLAVRAYQLDHQGRPPSELSELVPAYLDALPEDPFGKDHAPFLYRVSGDEWVIYSAGPNQKDDKAQYDWGNQDDKFKHRDELDICFSSAQFTREREEYLKHQERLSKTAQNL